MLNTIETKVIAAVAGATGGSALATFLLWLIGVLCFGGSTSASAAVEAAQKVPGPVSGLLLMVLAAAGAGVGGYSAPHTDRAVAQQVAPQPPAVTGDAPLPGDVPIDDIPAEPAGFMGIGVANQNGSTP